jgi:hypothetical protein
MSTTALYEVRGKTQIIEATVSDVNMKQWTIDAYSKRTGRNFPNVQISTPYLHHVAGEGMYAVPDIGATCMLCIPSDDSPPFVLGFVAPPKIEGDKKPTGTVQNEEQSAPMGFTYSVDRPPAEPGDIYLRGRNGNHLILHTEGVLEIAASPTASRIYMPLGHVIDLNQEYDMRTPAGAIHWGVQDITDKTEASWIQTLRIYASDKYADIRISSGYVTPAEMPPGDSDKPHFLNPIYEIAVIKDGFMDNGVQMSKEMKMIFQFTREGDISVKAWGEVFLKAKETISIQSEKNIQMKADDAISLDTDQYIMNASSVKINSSDVKIAGGAVGVARLGDQVTVALPPELAAIAKTPFIYGAISTSSQAVKVT